MVCIYCCEPVASTIAASKALAEYVGNVGDKGANDSEKLWFFGLERLVRTLDDSLRTPETPPKRKKWQEENQPLMDRCSPQSLSLVHDGLDALGRLETAGAWWLFWPKEKEGKFLMINYLVLVTHDTPKSTLFSPAPCTLKTGQLPQGQRRDRGGRGKNEKPYCIAQEPGRS